MKLETIKKDRKKKIIIGNMIVLSVVGCLTLTITRAKYKNIQNIKLANGTINYKAPDLKLAIKISEDGTTYKNSNIIPEGNYTFNIEKSKCRIPTSTLIGEEAPVAEEVSIEYIDGKINVFGVTKKDTRCYVYFDKVQGQTPSSIIADIKNRTDGSYKGSTKPTFTSVATGAETEDNNGIFETDDPMYGENAKTYYWRGAATTNHVIFDNKCWRIMRINGDKSIRLIYNGTTVNNNGKTCPSKANNSAVIMGSTDSQKHYATSGSDLDKSYYVGWTYGTEQRTLNGTASNIKTQAEKWYNSNISASAQPKTDTSGKFCNDRNVGQPYSDSSWSGYTTTWSVSGTSFAYAAIDRLWNKNTPTLLCDIGDTYNLKVGTITADEYIFAGGKRASDNSLCYLYTNKNYWTMTPSHWAGSWAFELIVTSGGNLGSALVNSTDYGLRPVINLRSDITFNLDSDGTQNNPYIVQ